MRSGRCKQRPHRASITPLFAVTNFCSQLLSLVTAVKVRKLPNRASNSVARGSGTSLVGRGGYTVVATRSTATFTRQQ